jgi:hypothetical protein
MRFITPRTALLAVCGLVLAIGLSGPAAAAPKAKKRAFTETLLGGQISGDATAGEQAYKVRDSISGSGAAIQAYKVTGTAFPLSGTDTNVVYFAGATMTTSDTFTLGTPDATGISAITGTGKCVKGTGRLRGKTCAFTFTGTYNTQNTITNVTIKGTLSG